MLDNAAQIRQSMLDINWHLFVSNAGNTNHRHHFLHHNGYPSAKKFLTVLLLGLLSTSQCKSDVHILGAWIGG